jgi:8-oxo-dGTP pyrophosphatase MutT (NUDIX family)
MSVEPREQQGMGLEAVLDRYQPQSDTEALDLGRIRELVASGDPWARWSPLHVTCSAVILHPPTRRVLLRWHSRMRRWLHVGGHADAGETSAFAIALREAREETGLADLASWPDAARPLLVHLVIVPVPAGQGEPEHEHADLRYLLATDRPEAAVAENAAARLRWLAIQDAIAVVAEDNLRLTFERVAKLLSPPASRTAGA